MRCDHFTISLELAFFDRSPHQRKQMFTQIFDHLFLVSKLWIHRTRKALPAPAVVYFFKSVYFLVQRTQKVGQFWLFCRKFMYFVVYFLQAFTMQWFTKIDKYQIYMKRSGLSSENCLLGSSSNRSVNAVY